MHDRHQVAGDPRIDLIQPRRRLAHDLPGQPMAVLLLERRPQRQQLVERQPQRIDFAPRIGVALEHLGARYRNVPSTSPVRVRSC